MIMLVSQVLTGSSLHAAANPPELVSCLSQMLPSLSILLQGSGVTMYASLAIDSPVGVLHIVTHGHGIGC